MGIKTIAQRIAVSTWLALLISFAVTTDRVVDLVFEEPDVAAASADLPASEEPDNAAEHVLMPSQSAQALGDTALLSVPLDFTASVTAFQPLAVMASAKPVSRHHPPPRGIPVSFLRPLRI